MKKSINTGTLSHLHSSAVSLLMIVVMAFSTMTASDTSAADSIKTDFGVYPEPSLPPLSQAGGKIIDPVFGTTILRLTDGSRGDSECGVSYSTIPVFNVNSTRAYVRCDPNARARFFQFNPTTFTASSTTTIPSPPVNLKQYWMIWSGTNPDVIYGNNGMFIYAYNVASQTIAPVVDATQFLLASERLNWQMSKSENDDVFADTFDGSSENIGYIVWRRSDNKVLLKQYESSLDEVEVDKTGRHLVVSRRGGGIGIWDLQTGAVNNLSAGFYHRGLGHATAFTGMNYGSLGYRSLATPTSVTKLLTDGRWSYATQQDHFSMLADNELWAMASRYSTTGSGVLAAFDNEIVQVATDGSRRVRRLAHHRSVVRNNDYNAQPKANISRNGRFVAFTSNWGNSNGRVDVYIVQIPPASPSTADTTPPATSTGLRIQ
jgi:hypothetical protein